MLGGERNEFGFGGSGFRVGASLPSCWSGKTRPSAKRTSGPPSLGRYATSVGANCATVRKAADTFIADKVLVI